MLILAGVAISTAVNGGDIFGRTAEAREKWNSSVKAEEDSIIGYMEYVEDTIKPYNVSDIDPNATNLPENKELSEFPGYIPIYTAEQLQKIATGEQLNINGTTYTMAANANYVLMNDLDLSGITMKPIGTFNGIFDGNGYKISKISIDTRSDTRDFTTAIGWTGNCRPAALFGLVVNGTIKNLMIENADMRASQSVAGIAGQGDNVTIENCYVKDSYIEWIYGNGNNNSYGGIIGFIGNNGGTIRNCKVVNTATSRGGCGIIGGTYGNTTVSNCEVYGTNSVMYRSAIVGNATKSITIENCKVQGVSIYESGFLAASQSGSDNKLTIKGSTLKDINYAMDTYWDGYGLMLNYTACETLIEDCHMQNCEVNCTRNNRQNIGLVVNNSNGKITIKDTTVDRVTTKNGIAILSGIIISTYGNIELINNKITNIKTEQPVNHFAGAINYASQNVSIDGCQIDSITVIGREHTGSGYGYQYASAHGTQVAGISSFLGMNTNYEIKNCKVSNFDVSGVVGGASGILMVSEGSSNSNTTKKITNCKVNNFKVKDNWAGYNNDYSDYRLFGGIAGWVYKIDVENCEVNGFEVDTPFGVLGGLIANINYSNVKGCKVKNVNLKSVNDLAGGLVSYAYDSIIENCEVSNATIQSKNSAGGLASIFYKSSSAQGKNITNCNVKDSTINGGLHVGGIAGLSNEGTLLNCTVNNVSTHSTTGSVGGIVGLGYRSLINECNVVSSNVKGEVASGANQVVFAGGIAGYCHTIRNCNVTNTNIESTNDIGVGGIIGQGHKYNNSEPLIENCNITGGSVKGKSSVGGISGVAATTISGCTAKDVTITGTGGQIGGIQGCGGELGDPANYKSNVPVTMSDCHVINCTIRGASDVGYIQGKNTYGYEGVTDTFTNCDYDNQTTIQ